MQIPTVPLVNPESPIIETGMEGGIAVGMKKSSSRAIHVGVVEEINSTGVIVLDKRQIQRKLHQKILN